MADSLGELLDELQGLRERASTRGWDTSDRAVAFAVLQPLIDVARAAEAVEHGYREAERLVDGDRAEIDGWPEAVDENFQERAAAEDALFTALAALRDAILSQNMERR